MSNSILQPPHRTHDVMNQPPPFEGTNLFDTDRALAEGLEREEAGWAQSRVSELAAALTGEPLRWGVLANANPPILRSHDRYGNRIDEVEYHPAYHELMRLAVSHGLHALPWREARPGAHVARAVMFHLQSQVEAGHGCPISMTYSIVPALRAQPEIAAEWEERIVSLEYDPRSLPATSKAGAICGMAMTEKQGGSDVRANTTRARPLGKGGPGGEYEITGHKWFCSAPMSDAFLTLAQTERGLSCFFLPRWRPDGTRNHILVQRLKDKLGNRSNASSEVEFDGAWARLVGDEGRGVPTIIEMVNHTRLDCVIGVAATTRQAVVQAIHHARHRSAFGRRLAEQPLMRNVLAELAIESEAATTVMLRLARAYDQAPRDEAQRRFARLATAVIKYWVCKRAPFVVAEALECLGGPGYVEEAPLARLYREAPLNGIWEGSGNVICLDVLRAIGRDPESLDLFLDEVGLAREDATIAAAAERVRSEFGNLADIEFRARGIVEKLALLLQGSLLRRHAPAAVADAFVSSRLGTEGMGRALGTLPSGVEVATILDRALPGGV